MFYILGQIQTQIFMSHSYIYWCALFQFCENLLLLQQCRYIFETSGYNELLFFVCLFVWLTSSQKLSSLLLLSDFLMINSRREKNNYKSFQFKEIKCITCYQIFLQVLGNAVMLKKLVLSLLICVAKKFASNAQNRLYS